MPRSRRLGAGSSHDWLRCSGKTQLAAFYAESQWRTRALDLLVWVDASSTASILSGYVAAARGTDGTRMAGIAESVAASFLGWLSETDRRWLIVLDDVPDSSVLQGLWPAGPADVVVTTPSTQALVGLPERAGAGARPVQQARGDELPGRAACRPIPISGAERST